jgi:O-antigen/teichoic acid export membrane protein
MINQVVFTFITKIITGLINLGLVVLAAQYLGAEGRGVISLLMLNITIVILFAEFSGGGALVFLLPRHNFRQLLLPAYVWAIIAALVMTTLLTGTHLSPDDMHLHLLIISLMYCFSAIHLNALIGLQRIRDQNLASLIQVAVTLGSFFWFLVIAEKVEIASYITSLYLGAAVGLATNSYLLFRKIPQRPAESWQLVIKQMFSSGFLVQLGNLLQLLNYRLGYYLLEIFRGNQELGVYSTGVSLAEALWLVSKSISMVQYARIANSNDPEYARTLTIQLVKFSLVSTLLILIPLCALPVSAFTVLFGAEFEEVKQVLIYLSVGTAAFSVSGIFSHYFSGVGQFHINTRSSAIGFGATLLFGILLIPEYGIMGAGITASLSYTLSTIYQYVLFHKLTLTQFREFLPKKDDWAVIKDEFTRYLQLQNQNDGKPN